MRRYLLAQTDNNLQVALTPDHAEAERHMSPPGHPGAPHAVPAQVKTPPGSRILALPGAFDIAFLPIHGGR